MGLDQLHNGGKRQTHCIKARPFQLWQGSAKGKSVTPVTHFEQQLAAFGACAAVAKGVPFKMT